MIYNGSNNPEIVLLVPFVNDRDANEGKVLSDNFTKLYKEVFRLVGIPTDKIGFISCFSAKRDQAKELHQNY